MADIKTAEGEKVKVKSKKGKKVLKGLGIACACIAAAVCVCTVITCVGAKGNAKLAGSFAPVAYDGQLTPEKDDDGNWCFTTDREFKAVQLTDVHIGGGFMSLSKDASALNAVAAMLNAEKPDLVIVTGDIAYPVPFQAGTFNNRTGAKLFAELMDSLGIYWTLSFGNHDTEAYSYFSREKISDFYVNCGSKYCLFMPGPDEIDGSGNQIIKVKNSLGVITQAFIVLDSHSYTDGDFLGIQWKYDNIHENQIQWYRNSIAAMNAENEKAISLIADEDKRAELSPLKTVKSMLFFHIPLAEFKDAWEEFADNGYKDTDNVKYETGIVGETGKAIYCGIGEDDLFETALELGSTKAVFCGHDHFNNFSVNYKGIDLVYGYSVDYLAYIGINKKGSQRGCTCITVSPDGTYTVDKYNLYSSGRYDMPAGFADDISMQFEDVTFQVKE